MNQTLVLGLGNPIMGDDGIGVAALQRLRDEWELPSEVTLVDGGTWGMNLLPQVESASRLILLDAVNSGVAPGTLTVLEREQLPRYFSFKLSPHQIDLREVLALAELRGCLPEELVALGIQPERIELATHLSPAADAALGKLVDLAVERLQAAGHICVRRTVAAGA